MKEYTIEWAEQRTIPKLNKTVLEVTLNDGQQTTDKVTLWPDEWTISEYRAGGKIKGELVIKKNGNYTNKTLKPERTNTLNTPAFKRSPSAITKAMEKKEESIGKFQANKESNIEKMAAFRDATLITNLYFDKSDMPFTIDEYMKKWEEVKSLLQNKLSLPF